MSVRDTWNGDTWAARRGHEEVQQNNWRKRTRPTGAQRLKAARVNFETKDNGAHLVIDHKGHHIDYWPATGLWVPEHGRKRRRGIRRLMDYLGRPSQAQPVASLEGRAQVLTGPKLTTPLPFAGVHAMLPTTKENPDGY